MKVILPTDCAASLCQKDSSFLRDLCNILEWLNSANLVVGMHYGNKDSAPSQRPADIFRIDASKAINSQVRHRRTKPFEEATGIYHCRMFHLGGNDVSIRSSTCEEHPFESVIISFTSATREYDLIGFTAEQPRRTCIRALSTAYLAGLPAQWPLEGLPYGSLRTILIASTTPGAVGVLALKSK